MRPQKLSREELLGRCAKVFKRHGYHGTTMDMLAAACDLTKASFYHHYSSKETLMGEVLANTHEQINRLLFSIAYQTNLSEQERIQQMARRAKKLFREDSIGCLMAVISIDATYALPDLMPQIRRFLNDWADALTLLFQAKLSPPQARIHARQAVADYEGAILLSRIHNDFSYFDRVSERIDTLFNQPNNQTA